MFCKYSCRLFKKHHCIIDSKIDSICLDFLPLFCPTNCIKLSKYFGLNNDFSSALLNCFGGAFNHSSRLSMDIFCISTAFFDSPKIGIKKKNCCSKKQFFTILFSEGEILMVAQQKVGSLLLNCC